MLPKKQIELQIHIFSIKIIAKENICGETSLSVNSQ